MNDQDDNHDEDDEDEEEEDAEDRTAAREAVRTAQMDHHRRKRRGPTPAMVVMYRLTGVDGEATEERVETLGNTDVKNRTDDRYGATAAVVQADGLRELVALVETDDDGVATRALGLLRQCAAVDGHASLLAKMGAPAALLARLVRALRSQKVDKNGSDDREVERLLGLLERLAPAMRDVTTTLEAQEDTHLETLVDSLRDARVAAALERTPALRRAVCRLLPALACGRRDAADALASRMTTWMRRLDDWARCFDSTIVIDADSSEKNEKKDDVKQQEEKHHFDLVEASCLRETAEGLGGDDVNTVSETVAGADDLGDALARNGFVAAAASGITARLPTMPPALPWTADLVNDDVVPQKEWVAALEPASNIVVACLRALRGACAASRACALAALDHGVLDAAHYLEQLPVKKLRAVGLAAEAFLDAVARHDSTKGTEFTSSQEFETQETLQEEDDDEKEDTKKRKRSASQCSEQGNEQTLPGIDAAASKVRHLRVVARRQRLAYARQRRAALLEKLGLNEVQPDDTAADDDEDQEGDARCVVCREPSKPRDVLCTYVFAKLAVSDVGDADGAFLLNTDASRFRGQPRRPNATSNSQGSNGRRGRRYALGSSVSALNVIHASCHRDATRAERNMRSPRAEWEGAALRNNRVLCNSIIPLRPPKPKPNDKTATSDAAAAQAAYVTVVDRHFSCLAQLGIASKTSSSSSSSSTSSSSSVEAPSRFTVVAHDVRLLLLRLAHRESLHGECGGGSRASNLKLVCYLLQLAAHLLTAKTKGGGATDDADKRKLKQTITAFTTECETHLLPYYGDTSLQPPPKRSPSSPPVGSPSRKRRRIAFGDDDDDDREDDQDDFDDEDMVTSSQDRNTPPPTPQKNGENLTSKDRWRRAEILGRLGECAPHIALLTLFTDDTSFDDGKTLFATFACRRAMSRAESRRDTQRDAHTRQRARTYARSMLSYVALVDRLNTELNVMSETKKKSGVPLLAGDDAAIALAANKITTFYDVLLEANDPRTILLDHLHLSLDDLALAPDVKSFLFEN